MALDTENSLATLADAKAWCRVAVSTTDYDDIIERFIDGVSWAFNKYCRRNIKARAYSSGDAEVANGDGSSYHYVRHPPINTMTALYVDSDHEFAADTEVSSDDYQTDDDDGMIYYEAGAFPRAVNTVKIEYNGGYSTIPNDIYIAALDEIKRRFDRWKKNAETVNRMSIPNGVDVTFISFDSFLSTTTEILNRYRIVGHVGARIG